MGRNEDDLTSRARDYESVQVAIGHVGWASGEHFDGGTETGADGERHTLVHVTLGGKNALTDSNKGLPIICALAGGIFRIPPKGTMVYVLVPRGMVENPGSALIIATREDDRRSNLVKGEMLHAAPEGAARIVLKNDGSVSFLTSADNTPDGKLVALTLSPTALKFTSPWGSITFDASGFHVRTKAGPRLDMGGISIPGLPAELVDAFTGYFKVTSPTIKMDGGSVFLGAGDVQQPAMYKALNAGLGEVPPAPQTSSTQSQSVWIAT